MKTKKISLAELNQQATSILLKKFGVFDTLRFFSQFQEGKGNYSKDRHQWLDKWTLQQIIGKIKEKQRRSK